MANNGEKKADEWVEDPDSDIMDAKVAIMMMVMAVIKMKISRDWVMKSLIKVDIFILLVSLSRNYQLSYRVISNNVQVMKRGDKRLIIVDLPDPKARWRKPI